uniref:ASPSCR1 tether for SLC2A4, UBX domain containing n=1 Tax=Fundulus heteroclitus TaxID=8078 RepID=A0A3Q2PTI3_FUNHE
MAASGSAVTVLTPNGRRQPIKVAPNTSLLQVLEDVCKKHGFDPNDHGLKFQRTVLDLTLPWRFANLPNNAKLEMVTSTRKQGGADGQVRIALQMEDGSRLQGSFSCGQSLWELIAHFPQIRCVVNASCLSMCKTTLKSLGLTGGSAIDKKTAGEEDEAVAVPVTPAAKEAPPGPSPQPDAAPVIPDTSADPLEAPPAPTPVPAASSITEAFAKPQDVVRPKVPPTGSEAAVEDGEEAGPSGSNSHPSSSSSSSSSSAPAAPFVPFSGGGQRLGALGGESGRTPSSSSSPALSALTTAAESPKAKKAKPSHSSSTKVSPSNTDIRILTVTYHLITAPEDRF